MMKFSVDWINELWRRLTNFPFIGYCSPLANHRAQNTKLNKQSLSNIMWIGSHSELLRFDECPQIRWALDKRISDNVPAFANSGKIQFKEFSLASHEKCVVGLWPSCNPVLEFGLFSTSTCPNDLPEFIAPDPRMFITESCRRGNSRAPQGKFSLFSFGCVVALTKMERRRHISLKRRS